MSKKWKILSNSKGEDILSILLENRGLKTKKEQKDFLNSPNPYTLNPNDVDIDKRSLTSAIKRIAQAIKEKESIVVYADYDADGICSGAIMWETLHMLGARVMPYIPHRVEEGYGLSIKGIDTVKELYNPTLIITVDHGITAKEKVAYAKKLGIEVIVTDHHVKPKDLPDCTIIHTTKLCGSGVSWFVAKEVLKTQNAPASLASLSRSGPAGGSLITHNQELIALAAIGTIADMVPLVGPNRVIVKAGLEAINKTNRVGLDALINQAGLTKGAISTYEVSHILAPRLNAMGRLEHALDALRLICTHKREQAQDLAEKLGLTNKERQQLTLDTTAHALEFLKGVTLSTQGDTLRKKLLFVADESYNQGVIGLVAGKLVETYYLPAIVVSKGEDISKASARSIRGFNIIEAIRAQSDILIDVGGHPMAAGFTIETKNLKILQERLEALADKELDEDTLTRSLNIDLEIPLELVSEKVWQQLQTLAPFGFGNPEPVFATRKVIVKDIRLVGADSKHLKLVLAHSAPASLASLSRSGPVGGLPITHNAIAFSLGNLYGKLKPGQEIDIAYSIDINTWNGKKSLQLKIKDIQFQ